MRYIFDTNALIDQIRGKAMIDPHLVQEGAIISIITLGELYYGAYKSNDPKKSLIQVKDIIETLGLHIETLNERIMNTFAEIKGDLERAGTRLEDFDLLIAATAIVSKRRLVTKNKKHFQRIEGLELYS